MPSGVKGSSGVCQNHPEKKVHSKGLCKTCYKEQWWRDNPDKYNINKKRKIYARYGLTIEQYETILAQQEGVCAVCKEPLTDPVIDHDHDSGVVRGIVHRKCNFLLGLADENVSILSSAIRYLKDASLFWNPTLLSKYKTVEKIWGTELWLVNCSHYGCKILKLNKDFQCSLHYHKLKTETFIVIRGHVKLEVPDVMVTLGPGDSYNIHPGMEHRFTGLTDALIVEVSTMHLDSDSYRLEESRKIES